MIKSKKLVAATMLLSHKKIFNSYEFYSPRGFLLDFKDKKLVSFFTEKIKEYIKNKRGYVLKIDPYIIYKQRDIDGNIIKDGEDNSDVVNNLLNLGFKKVPINNMQQVGWMFSLNIDGKDENQIFKEMKSNTRNIIKKTEKIGIKLKEINYNELDKFQKIMIDTGKRKHFKVRNLDYFQEMYKIYNKNKEIKFFITELNLKEYINKLNKEKSEKEEKINNLNNSKHSNKQKNNLQEELNSIIKRINEIEKIVKNSNTDIIVLSGAMFILIKPEIIYLEGGNYKEYMNFNSQYLIQWNLIKYGINNGFKKYNFYGIPANINEHPKDYGIYEFKKGFNGYVEELIGEYVLPINYKYYLFNIIHKIRNLFKED